MISAQNHLPLLSGSKFISKAITRLLVFFTFVIYFAIPQVKATPPAGDSSYKIAMILPLHLYHYQGNNVNRANIMLDYYQGFYLALKEYEDKGLNLKLYLFDNAHDTNKTKEILQNPQLKSMDLIISPILDEHLHLINRFSSKYQIPVFSPFTAIDSLYPNNPLFFNAAPARKTKAEIFYDYYRKTNPDKTLLLLKNESDWNKGFGSDLVKLLETKSNIDYRVITAEEMALADSNFLPKEKSYLVYNYYGGDDMKGLKYLISFLDKQKASFEVLGDYKPLALKNFPETKRKKYNVKILTSDFLNPLDSAYMLRDFKVNYRLISNLNPSRYSVIGHDQACFISEMILKYHRFRANDFVGDSYEYYATRFTFKKDPHCNQNKGLFILKINENDQMEEVKY